MTYIILIFAMKRHMCSLVDSLVPWGNVDLSHKPKQNYETFWE